LWEDCGKIVSSCVGLWVSTVNGQQRKGVSESGRGNDSCRKSDVSYLTSRSNRHQRQSHSTIRHSESVISRRNRHPTRNPQPSAPNT